MIDQVKKRALIEHIKSRKGSNEQELLLPPDLYFDGYDDEHCTICANISEPISTSRFAARLREIEQRPDVFGVFVRFYDFADAEESEDFWISSDSIYIATSAGTESVREWFSDFEISDVWVENELSKFIGLPKMPDGSKLIAVWWD
jgi:hypothetical protein